MSKKKGLQFSATVDQERHPTSGASRRDFLKVGGIAAAGLASSTALGVKKALSSEDVPVVLECAINETRRMPYEPKTVEEHITEMTKVLDAGVAVAHNHSKQFDEDPNKAA